MGDVHVLVHDFGSEVLIGNDLGFESYKISLLNRPSICLKYCEDVSCQTESALPLRVVRQLSRLPEDSILVTIDVKISVY